MKFPGKRKNKHYFPVTEKGRESADPHYVQDEPFYLVGMDQLLVDASTAGAVAPGDRVTLWGGDGPSADELAAQLGTVSYELITRVMPRVDKEYVG